MASVLLIIIYIAFIGLGIPDSMFGAAWPAIYEQFQLPVSWASFVTVITAFGTILSSLFSDRLIRRFGTGRITAFSTTLTAAALLGFSISGSMLWLCLFAFPLGLGAGAIDAALNNYVALHYRATHMNFLHCFYGVGIALSPFLMSFALSEGSWRRGYATVFCIQLGIALLTIFTLPLWKKVGSAQPIQEAGGSAPGNPISLLREKQVRRACLVFFGSCGVENICNTWGSTFLVSAKGMEADRAALTMTAYFIGMAIGRFLSGLLANRLTSRQLMRIGQGIVLVAVILLLLPLPAGVSGVGLFLVGMGNGPVFPNMLHLTPRYFGVDRSQAVMGVEMAVAYVGSMVMPVLFGAVAQQLTLALFPTCLLLLYVLTMTNGLLLDRTDSGAGKKCMQTG